MTNALIFSYIPLVYGDPTANYLSNPEKIMSLVENAEPGAKGAIWYGNGKKTGVVLVYDNAKEIKEHLIAWTERKPKEWFKLIADVKDGMYSIVLMPILEKSVERWRLQYLISNGYQAPDDLKITFIFKPLNFVTTRPSKMSKNVKERKVEFSLIDVKDAEKFIEDMNDGKVVHEVLHKIGTYKLKIESNQLTNEMLEEAKKDFMKFS